MSTPLEILQRGVDDRVFPGGVLLVADGGEIVTHQAFGHLTPDSAAVTTDTRYDVASLTKVCVTTTLVMRLIEAGRLALDTPVATYVPELALASAGKDKLRVLDLLTHSSGLPAWRPFYETLLDQGAPPLIGGTPMSLPYQGAPPLIGGTPMSLPHQGAPPLIGGTPMSLPHQGAPPLIGGTPMSLPHQGAPPLIGGTPMSLPILAQARRDELVRLAAREPLEAAPGERSVYSDLGFILLGAVAERSGGARLDELAAATIFRPLGMNASQFVDLSQPARPSPVAPTELCPRRGLVVGEVHDDNCHAAGGITGHAGLFSTAEDLSRLTAALVTSFHGRRPEGGFPQALVKEFFTPCAIPGSTRRLGWDGPSPIPGESSAGELWPKSGVGHLGFTGCSLWIDPSRSRWVILLTNRVHPSREDTRIKQLRPILHDAIVASLPA